MGRIMPQSCARAVLFEQVGRVGHALHPAGDHHIDGATGERFCPHDHGLHSAAAHFVDGGGLNGKRQACLDRGLARRGLAKPGWQHAADIGAVDILTRHAGALNRRLDRHRTKIGRGNIGQRALHRAHRGAGVGKDDDRIGGGKLGHGKVLASRRGDVPPM